MSNAFNVNALRDVHTKTFGADSINSFDKAIEHATTLLANSSRGMRGNVSHQGVIRRFFAPKTLSFYRKNMSLVFDVPEADINDLTVYYYITTVAAKTAFDEAECLKIGYIVADGTAYFNYITTDAVLNESWLGVFEEQLYKLYAILSLVTDSIEYTQSIVVLPKYHWNFTKEYLCKLLNRIATGVFDVKVNIVDPYNIIKHDDGSDKVVSATEQIDSAYYTANQIRSEWLELYDPLMETSDEEELLMMMPQQNPLWYILETRFIERANDTQFKQMWYDVNKGNKQLCNAARLLEFYVFCDTLEASGEVINVSQYAMELLNEQSIASCIAIGRLQRLGEVDAAKQLLQKAQSHDDEYIEATMCFYDGLQSFTEGGACTSVQQQSKSKSNPEVELSLRALFLYRNDDERQKLMRPKNHRRSNNRRQQKRQPAAKQTYHQARREAEPVKPFGGVEDIEKCFNQYRAVNNVDQLEELADNMLYQSIKKCETQLREQIPRTFDTEERKKLEEQLCEVQFKKYVRQLNAVASSNGVEWQRSEIIEVARGMVKKDNMKISGCVVSVNHEEFIDNLME